MRVGTSRSTAKLKSLHGEIALDLETLYGNEFTICSQGYGNDKEGCIEGRYYPKNVDITIKKDDKPVAGYAVKFVMRNYSQNKRQSVNPQRYIVLSSIRYTKNINFALILSRLYYFHAID